MLKVYSVFIKVCSLLSKVHGVAYRNEVLDKDFF